MSCALCVYHVSSLLVHTDPPLPLRGGNNVCTRFHDRAVDVTTGRYIPTSLTPNSYALKRWDGYENCVAISPPNTHCQASKQQTTTQYNIPSPARSSTSSFKRKVLSKYTAATHGEAKISKQSNILLPKHCSKIVIAAFLTSVCNNVRI